MDKLNFIEQILGKLSMEEKELLFDEIAPMIASAGKNCFMTSSPTEMEQYITRSQEELIELLGIPKD